MLIWYKYQVCPDSTITISVKLYLRKLQPNISMRYQGGGHFLVMTSVNIKKCSERWF